MVPVIDISKWQGAVDFTVMASHGVRGVIIRGGNGLTLDAEFDTYASDARAAGLTIGAYWFCNPKAAAGAAAQGHMLAAAHNRATCDLPPMLDVENYTRESGSGPVLVGPAFAQWLHSMATQVEIESRRPIIYANASYWNPTVHDDTFGDHDLICARYPFYNVASCAANTPPLDANQWADWIMDATRLRPSIPNGWATWAGWQFSAGFNGRGHAYGCSSTDLDLNIITDEAWERWTGGITPSLPPVTVPPVIVTPNTNEEPAMTYVLYRATGRPDALVAFDGSGLSALINPGSPVVEDWGNTMLAYGPGNQQYATAIDCTPEHYDGILHQCNNKRENAAITATIGVPNPLHVAVDSEPTRTTT